LHVSTEVAGSVAELVGQRAAERPGAIAIEDGPERLTYAELDLAASRIAVALRAAGTVDEEPVAVCLPRSWQAICAFLGVLRAGCAYVPIDPAYPALRQERLLDLAGVRLALTGSDHEHGLPRKVRRLDCQALARTRADEEPPDPPGDGDRLAYVLFTSGSTGTPKGVEITHANLLNLLLSPADVVPGGDDTVLQAVPLGFDVSGLEIWGTLLNGGRLVVAPRGRLDPSPLGGLIAARGVTMLTISTGLLHELIRAALPDLGGLRICVAIGDVLSPQAVETLRSKHPQVRVLNGYGPTEATIVASSYEVVGAEPGPVPIGRPLPGYRLEVLDESGRPLEDGEPGELWIGGAGVARGYRNDPERTAERFREDGLGGERRYRTGDRAALRADGELVFLGRLDDQVKIDGHRVEPAEVEQVLAGHPDVYEAAVLATEEVPGHKRLVAYVVMRQGGESQADLREHLGRELPDFMVPQTIVALEEMPRNERGKVDRAALPRPRRENPADLPDDPEVADVARIVAEVLHLEAVGANEDFFELGGTSLLALQLVGRLRERRGARLGVRAVFEERTPAGLASALDASSGAGAEPQLPPLRAGSRGATAPLSAAQRRALLFERMHPDSIAYQFAAIFRFEGPLETAALRGALEDLLGRHEILRTSFGEVDGEAVQIVHRECAPRLETVDLREDAVRGWPRLVRARVGARIDPAGAPLVRWTLARLGEESWALLHVEHHLVHDGWSFAVLADELAELYSARREERRPDLPEPVAQFQDYARWERDAHRSVAVGSQIDRWVERLDRDPPPIELPAARPRPPLESFSGGSVRRRVGADLLARLRRLAEEGQVTLFMVALAAFLAQLRLYSGEEELQVGSGLANRRDPNAERLLGMIVNTVAIRCDLSGNPTVRELLTRVRRAAVDAYADADAPFEAVVEAMRPPRRADRSPLIQALFSFHDAPRGSHRWSGLRCELVQVLPNGTAKADLNVIGIAEDGALSFVWEHSDLLDDGAADRLAGHHLRLMEQFVERPDARLSDLDLIGEDERGRLADWRLGKGSYDREATVHDLVAAQARRTPEAIAVIDDSGRLSYGELLDRARSVAASLGGRGVERGDLVGVLLERSAGSVVSQLGILAAGAAYLPLDPAHPPARIAAALSDGGVAVVLTDPSGSASLPAGVEALWVEEALAAPPVGVAESAADDLAYVVYTSGSTGEPKGVEVTHRNVVRLVDDPDYAELGSATTMLHAASPAFDATTFEVWGPLVNGGTVACLGERPSPESIVTAIEERGVTSLWLTAGLFNELVDRRPQCLAGVREVLTGGDALSPDHVRRALAALPRGARLVNGYGPTETTTFATVHELRPGDRVEDTVPIGRPIQGTTCDVVDADGRTLPIGVAGELAIGGDGVARGYSGDPALTAARFRPDPERPGERRYLSGDRTRLRADGTLEFLGRIDRQVKVRGVRVEPAEVEGVLRSHGAIGDVAVAPFERSPRDRALAAYVVAAPGAVPPAAGELRVHAMERLPAAMVPSAWVTLERLPLNANGKLDRDRLPPPGREHLAVERSPTRPRGAAERRVVECFENVLGVRPVGVEDDFFALGGHSLLVLALFAELERSEGRRLPLATIFEAPTPRTLAARLVADAPPPGWDNLVALKPQGTRPPLFVVAAGDGNVVGFAPLARSLSAQQPLYALQPSGLDGRRPLDAGIAAMATRYLGALRRVQPHGPYLLAGRCNGATVAYEMAQRLRAAGEEVSLLAALDSDPPPAGPRELAPGIPYDPIMESAWMRARDTGEEAPGPGEPRELATWLAAEVAPGVSRYLFEAWRWRDDLGQVWPQPLGADARALAEWGWDHGCRELGLARSLLQPRPAGDEPASERLRRARARASRVARELGMEARWLGTDWLERLLDRPLPEARARIERRVVAAARRARGEYRAEPWPGRVLLIVSSEFAGKPTYPAWDLRAVAGVDRRELPVGHVEMLRGPGVEILAHCLEECIEEALSRRAL
jgi:amino acid adenylation domain-containing protein